MPDFDLLLACMLVIGGGLYWMVRMAGFAFDERSCDQCGKMTGITWVSDAYYCSFECAAYAGDYSVKNGWKISKEHLSEDAE